MATVLISAAWPEIPDASSTRWRHRLSSELAALASLTNHYACYRVLRESHRIITYDADTVDLANVVPASSSSHRITWPSHPLAEAVWFALTYQAHPSPSSGNTRIDLTLYDHGAGTVIDEPAGSVGVRLDEADGGLEAERRLLGGLKFEYTTLYAISGAREFTPGSYPSQRRPLSIPSANRGNRLRVAFDMENVRLLKVDIIEAALSQVTI